VRVHTDTKAGELSTQLNARAFTIGSDVAFGGGEYRPGTLVGDALIAHELAHVVQQGGGKQGTGAKTKSESGSDSSSLEQDADRSAVGAVVTAWTGAKNGLTMIGANALPRLKSGLKLQKCSGDEKTFEPIKAILNGIPAGREALLTMQKYKVGVKFVKGRYFFDPDSNTMFLNSDHDAARSALDFIHELYHAKTHNEKTTPDVQSLSRQDYVNKMLEEEAEGTVRSIEGKMQLEGTKTKVRGAVFPLESEYRTAFKAAADKAKVDDPKIVQDELNRIGRDAGKKRVLDGFKNGEVVVSGSTQPYPDYYGKEWDKRHTK
jgi:hypothetical protein